MSFDLMWMENFDDDFKPDGGPAKVESLTDGDYDFEVKKSAFKILEKKPLVIIEMELEVLSPGKHSGQIVQHALFIKDKESAARVGKDLATLGFDCAEWTVANGRPFSQEIQKVDKVLFGLRFKGKKQVNGKFHNLYINKRLLPDGKPEHLGADELNGPDTRDPFAGFPE